MNSKIFLKKTFKILFWTFWILIGLVLIGLALGIYVQLNSPQNVDVDNVQGIIPKIVAIITIVSVTFVTLGVVFGITLAILAIYLLVTALILFFKWLIKRKR